MAEQSFTERFEQLADQHPNAPAVTLVGAPGTTLEQCTWQALTERSHRVARALKASGVGLGSFVTIALPNSVDFFVACFAAWKLGAIPQPVSSRLPPAELDAIVTLAKSAVVIGENSLEIAGRECVSIDALMGRDGDDAMSLPDCRSPHWKAPTSGGSTGRPKLIVAEEPAVFDADEAGLTDILRLRRGGATLVPGPMYHNGPFVWAFQQMLYDGHVVLLERFDAEATLDAIARFSANTVYLVPTMMNRIWKLPVAVREQYDLGAIDAIWHLAAPCPPWLKEAWIDWLGADRVWELYGGTEGQSATVISGEEWLAHRGSVGRPVMGEITILDDTGHPVAANVVGEVFMRPDDGRVTYHYIGAEPRQNDGGWESLGDMGWLDDDGYLYLTDRRTDMILSGGANIYPAEVEAALETHPAVSSCAVIGLPDDDLGQRVHAVVHAPGATQDELIAHVGSRLVRYKVPRSIELVDTPVRDDAGKVRRSALLADRVERS
ncbi:MAG: AMP-binding protein [Pseudomonadota bacterium]